MDIEKLSNYIEEFAQERDWEQFHNLKNLVMALSVESSELVEIFQWLSVEEAENIGKDSDRREHVAEEIADIFIYLLKVAKKLDIDLEEASYRKMQKNALKYPVEKSRGKSTKYSDFT